MDWLGGRRTYRSQLGVITRLPTPPLNVCLVMEDNKERGHVHRMSARIKNHFIHSPVGIQVFKILERYSDSIKHNLG